MSGRPAHGGEPWSRYGALMWVVWLVFLVYPVAAVVRAEEPLGVRVGGLVLVVAFAAAYTWGGARTVTRDDVRLRTVVAVLVSMLALALALAALIGSEALALVPFFQSLVVFGLPRPVNWALAAVGIAVTVVVSLDSGGLASSGPFLLVVAAVTLGCVVGRMMADQGAAYAVAREQLSLTAERDRVARDVHDVLGHSLTVVSVKAELAERLLDSDLDRARAELADIRRLARESLAEVRSTVGGLRAARLDEELEHASDALRSAGVLVAIDGAAGELDPRRRAVAAWALRELVTNVVRHSGATRCRVLLGPDRLVVEDDGRGGADVASSGHGLRGLTERVGATGGRLAVGPGAEGRGTRAEVSW